MIKRIVNILVPPAPSAAPLARHLGARAACLRQTDRDRLFAAPDSAAGATAPELAALHLVHRPSYLFAARAAVFARHDRIPLGYAAEPRLLHSPVTLTPSLRSSCRCAVANAVGRLRLSSDSTH